MNAHQNHPGDESSEGAETQAVDRTDAGTSQLLTGRRKGSPWKGCRTVAAADANGQAQLTPQQRLLALDTWMKSGLPAGDFAPLVGVSKHTPPTGLMAGQRGGPRGSWLDEVTKRAVLLMKSQHPEWGVERIAALLERGPGLAASPGSVLRVLEENGYQVEERPTAPHPDHVRSFERATPNQLWQSDLFTFVLKRQNQRVYLVAFLDDHSRFVVITRWSVAFCFADQPVT